MGKNVEPVDNGEAERKRLKAEAEAEADRKRLKAEEDLRIWRLREEWGGNG